MSINNIQSFIVSTLRFGLGWTAVPESKTPDKTLIMYEFEACPFCRKAREALTVLDLDYVCLTSARGSTSKRGALVARGGKAQFPYLIDPNTGVEMYESEAIITYLHDTYGQGRSGLIKRIAPLNSLTSAIASGVRATKGRAVREGLGDRAQPPKMLELYSFEISPYCRKVRERLHELNLDVLIRNVGKKGKRRPELLARGGKMMVPYLIDPNTGVEMYESDEILAYLDATYGAASLLEASPAQA